MQSCTYTFLIMIPYEFTFAWAKLSMLGNLWTIYGQYNRRACNCSLEQVLVVVGLGDY